LAQYRRFQLLSELPRRFYDNNMIDAEISVIPCIDRITLLHNIATKTQEHATACAALLDMTLSRSAYEEHRQTLERLNDELQRAREALVIHRDQHRC
jgi:hypothetical protein